MPNCKNCNRPVTENFCSNCGHPVKLKRIDSHYILHEIIHVLHLEKGIFYTVKELAIRPGESVKEFISENRNRLVKPIIFIIISSLIYSIVSHLFHIEEGYITVTATELERKMSFFAMMDWLQGHYGYANIMMGMFVAFWLKLFFKKYDYSFFEVLILLCFVMGMGMLVLTVSSIIEGLTHMQLMSYSGMLFMAYATWAIGQFYDKKKISSYLKAVTAYLLGGISFMITLFLVGMAIDMIFKH